MLIIDYMMEVFYMIKANIEAEIEAKQNRRNQIFDDLVKLDKIIDNIKEKKYILLDEDSQLYFEIEELKVQLND